MSQEVIISRSDVIRLYVFVGMPRLASSAVKKSARAAAEVGVGMLLNINAAKNLLASVNSFNQRILSVNFQGIPATTYFIYQTGIKFHYVSILIIFVVITPL